MKRNIFSIAKCLIERSSSPMDHLKLQKLVFISFGLYAAYNEDDLFSESIQAWQYGPVVKELYNRLKKYQSNFIPVDEFANDEAMQDDNVIKSIDKVLFLYGDKSGSWLVNHLHLKGSVWHDTFDGTSNNEIDKQRIREYYRIARASAEAMNEIKDVFEALALT